MGETRWKAGVARQQPLRCRTSAEGDCHNPAMPRWRPVPLYIYGHSKQRPLEQRICRRFGHPTGRGEKFLFLPSRHQVRKPGRAAAKGKPRFITPQHLKVHHSTLAVPPLRPSGVTRSAPTVELSICHPAPPARDSRGAYTSRTVPLGQAASWPPYPCRGPRSGLPASIRHRHRA
jgi:hypothetical protein